MNNVYSMCIRYVYICTVYNSSNSLFQVNKWQHAWMRIYLWFVLTGGFISYIHYMFSTIRMNMTRTLLFFDFNLPYLVFSASQYWCIWRYEQNLEPIQICYCCCRLFFSSFLFVVAQPLYRDRHWMESNHVYWL